MPLVSWQSCLAAATLLLNNASAFTGFEYRLSHEYSGTNFFDGWDFYSGRDPTGGFVTYYSRSSAQLTDLIRTTENGPAYMGVNYVDKLPFNNQTGRGDGAGRPSVRIASKQAFTHGLFIGDFEHIPAGICGTWPAFWTLGPNWPYTGEIDILEGVNQNTKNVMSLHTNETCIIEGTSDVMSGQLENTNCAYYPDYNVGCGVSDPRQTSFGVGFNQAGGGVYAMQWTSEYIRIWHWARADVPADVNDKSPDPGSWGLPAAQLGVGNCTIDQHFQSHKIIFDTTFCGEYAGNPYVWKTSDATSCQDSTGLATCDNFVANKPEAFEDAYWSVNYVRVYQLVNPIIEAIPSAYIASEQAPNTATNAYTAPNVVATPSLDVDALCPQYNFSIISDGKYQYEIACDFDPPGPDLTGDPYPGFRAKSLADCIKGCTFINENRGANICGGVAHFAEINFCYFKKYIDGSLKYRPGYNQIRLIYYGYPQISDDPRSLADSTLTSSFIETIPTPQTYRASTVTNMTTRTTTTARNVSISTTSRTSTIGAPPMGDNSTSTTRVVPTDYSETVTSGYLSSMSTSTSAEDVTSGQISSTRTLTSLPPSVSSTNPSATNADFYIVFNIDVRARKLLKREIQYLAFNSEAQSILVTNQMEAASFRNDADGLLISGGQYVALDSNADPPRFLLTDDIPDTPARIEVDENGTVIVEGVDGYCLTTSGDLAVDTESGDLPVDCASVEPELVAAPNDGTSTSSSITMSSFTSSATSQSNSNPSSSTMSSSSRTSSTAIPSTTPRTVNNFTYAGCFGIPVNAASLPGISPPTSDPSMTNDECTSLCGQQNAYYAGTYGDQCFCGASEALHASLLNFPDASCNKPCPGANRDICGGEVSFQGAVPTTSVSSLDKRGRLFRRQSAIFLISLYNNTVLLGGPGGTDVPGTTDIDTDTATDTVTDTVTAQPTNTDDPFLTASVSYNVTGTNIATVISTTYVDLCPVCPGGLTTKSTTITIPHCGCTASYDVHAGQTVSVPSPVVPMLTTTKQCACGHKGAQITITVTVPHASSIAELASQVLQVLPSQPPSADVGILSSVDKLNGQSVDTGTMQSPSPADAPTNSGIDNKTGVDGRFGSVDESAASLPEDDHNFDDDWEPDNENTADDSDSDHESDADFDDDYDDDNEHDFEPIDTEPSNTDETPATLTAPVDLPDDSNIAAAPASSPEVAVASNTAVPAGISNYTASAVPGGNGTLAGSGFGPVASFTSGAGLGAGIRTWDGGLWSADWGIVLLGCVWGLSLGLGMV